MDIKAKIAQFLRELIQYNGKSAQGKEAKYHTAQTVLRNALTMLQCTYEEDDWNDEYVAFTFDYQAGHFRAFTTKSPSYFASIYFYSIMSAPEEELSLVRYICNDFNDLPSNIKVYYTFDSKENEYDINLCANIFLNGEIDDPKTYLAGQLNSFFDFRRSIFEKYQDTKKATLNEVNKDKEANENNAKRELHLFLETEMSHKSPEPYAGGDTRELRLLPMLEQLFELNDIEPVSITSVCGAETTTITDRAQMLDYDPTTAIIAGEGSEADFRADTAMINLVFSDPSLPKTQRTISMHLQREESTPFVLYMRLSAMLIPLSPTSQHTLYSVPNTIFSKSVIVAFDKKSMEQKRQEFQYMLNDAHDKMAKGDTDALSDEQKMIADISNASLGSDLYWGRKYMREKRYYEATLYLTNAYRVMNGQISLLSETQLSVFHEVMYILGFCYCEMQNYPQAYFFLDALFHLNQLNYTMEYVNCLVNSHDFRARNLVGELLKKVNDMEEECIANEEELEEGLKAFQNFLRRRQVYVMIDNREYSEAKKLLSKLILDPDNSDFALNELAYIQKITEDNADSDDNV
ncbi:MAG: hypothetical protein J1E57_04810 [Prevotella sp.]|nr:hypothetical protein [Prevotella sp.]